MKLEPPLDPEFWTGIESDAQRSLISCAIDSFAERGYHGSTTREIAMRAGLSSAAMYAYYSSKHDMLLQIMRIAHREVLTMMRAAATEPDVTERLAAVVGAHVRFHAHRHTAARIANHELAALNPAGRREIIDLRHQIEAVVIDTLEAGVRDGSFKVSDVQATTFAILSMGIGVSRYFSVYGRLSADELADHHSELAVRMVCAQR